MIRHLPLVGLVLGGAALAQAAEVSPVLDNPHLTRGDAAAGVDACLGAIEAAPQSPEVPYLLWRARQAWDEVPGGRAEARRRLEAVLADLPPCFNRDDLLAQLVDLRRADGDVAEAVAGQRARGLILEWQAAGAFGIRPNAALHDPFPPELAAAEREVDLRARFPTLRGETSWRPVAGLPLHGAVSLSEGASQEGAVAYALTHVELDLPAATEGYLVYSGGSAKLWLNRSLVGMVDRARERLDRELFVPVNLRPGWNRLLVKVTGGTEARFSLRITDGEGGAVVPRAVAAAEPVDAARPGELGLQGSYALTRLAEDATPSGRALHALGLALTGRGEEAWLALEALAAAAPELSGEAWFLLLRGDVAQRADHLPEASRREQARSAYEAALEVDPQLVQARRRLAEFAFQDDREVEGVVLLERVLADAPGDVGTALRLFQAFLGEGWLLEAAEVLEGLEVRAPDLPAVITAKAQLLERRGDPAGSAALLERLFAADRTAGWTVLRRLDQALAASDLEAARARLGELEALQVLEEDDLALKRLEVARALEGRTAEVAALRGALRTRPFDTELRLRLAARLAEDAEQEPAAREEAVDLLGEVLAREPEHHDARRLREALTTGEDRFWEEWEPDVAKLLAEAPGKDHWPRAATVCLFDQTVTRVYPDGSSRDVVHQLWRLLDDSGKERYGSRPQAGETLEVRTITPSGQVLEPIRAGSTFEMPGLAPGAVVEHAFKLERAAPDLQLSNGPFYFMDPELSEPFWLSRWVIELHKDAPVSILQRNMERPGITHTVEERGDWIVHVFTARDQPRVEPEPLAPHRDELLPWVKLLEERTLEELGALYREQALTSAVVTPLIERKAAELVAEVEGDAARAQVLYRFVQDHVTGSGGFGNSASQTLAQRAGSKTDLFLALLEAAGVPRRLVFAAQAPEQAVPVDWEHPEPGWFGIAVVRVEPRDAEPVYVYADGARYAPYGRLPAQLWGAPAYVCYPEGGLIELLPREEIDAEAPRTVTHVALEEGGGATVEVLKVLPGYGVFQAKESFASAPEHQLGAFFAQQANQLFPGSRVLEHAAEDLREPGVPLALRFTAQAPRAVRARGEGRLELGLPITPARLGRALGAHRARLFDIVIRDPIAARDEVTVALGPYACARLPENVTLATRLGQFSLLFRRDEDGSLRIDRVLTIRPGRITPAEYPAFREFLRRMDEAEARTIALVEARAS